VLSVAAIASEDTELDAVPRSTIAASEETELDAVPRSTIAASFRKLPGMKKLLSKTKKIARARMLHIAKKLGIRRRRVSVSWFTNLKKKPKTYKVVAGKVKPPGYTYKDAYTTRGGKYILGANRRRIGAGFGRRRRRTAILNVKKRHYKILKKLGKRFGAKSKSTCKSCLSKFIKNGGCQAMRFTGKSSSGFLPIGCRHCAKAATAHCLFLKGKLGAWRRRRSRFHQKRKAKKRKANRKKKFSPHQWQVHAMHRLKAKASEARTKARAARRARVARRV